VPLLLDVLRDDGGVMVVVVVQASLVITVVSGMVGVYWNRCKL